MKVINPFCYTSVQNPPLCSSTAIITNARQNLSQMLLTDAVLKDAALRFWPSYAYVAHRS